MSRLEQKRIEPVDAESLGMADTPTEVSRDSSPQYERVSVLNRHRNEAIDKTRQHQASGGQSVTEIYAMHFPTHTVVDKDANKNVKYDDVIGYGKIDQATDAITSAVARKLPNALGQYEYENGKAHDEIEVPGLGKLAIEMHQHGPFSFVYEIKGPGFKITNARTAGRIHSSESRAPGAVEWGWPSDITIDALDLTIRLYADHSGIFVHTKGLEYSNQDARVMSGGDPNSNDLPWSFMRDDLYPTIRGFENARSEDIRNQLSTQDYLKEGESDPNRSFDRHAFWQLTRKTAEYESFVLDLRRPYQLSWQAVSSQATAWLGSEVLEKLLDK